MTSGRESRGFCVPQGVRVLDTVLDTVVDAKGSEGVNTAPVNLE